MNIGKIPKQELKGNYAVFGKPEINRLKQQLERTQRELSSYKVAAAQVGNQLTEISRLNQEISRSRREIDLILKTTSDAMRLVDRDFNVIWANAAMEQFCGSDSPTLKKKKCHEVIRSNRCGTGDCLLIQVLKENRQISEEVTINVNGTNKQAITVASPFRNEEGEITGILEDFIDITTSKQAEDTLRESEEKYRNIFEAAGDILLLLDKRGRILDANHKLLTVGGYKREEIIGKNIRKLAGIITLKSMPIIIANYLKRMAGKSSPPYEVQLITKFGEVRDVEISASVIRRGGKIVADLAILRDITKRKEAEKNLRDSEAKYRAVVEQIPAIAYMATPGKEGRIVYVSPQIETMLGFTPAQWTAVPCPRCDHVHPGDRERVLARLKQTRENGKLLQIEYRIIARDGRVIWFHDEAVVVRDDNGTPIFLQGVMYDITERKKYEGELLKIQKLESIGVLAGGIAHDFNNLLTAIVANISLVKAKLKPGDPHREMLAEAEKACFLSKDLTQQLLTFSRGGEPVKRVISVSELIEESARFSLRGSNVTCAFNLAPDLWPVMVDSGQLSQVINNLIINADQAMPGGGTITVGAENTRLKANQEPPLTGGNYIKIFVDDEGMGIPREALSKIFDPFFSTKSGGSGLGLAISYSIVNNHEGHIIAEPRVGRGTRFSIFLPATRIKLIEKDSPRQIFSPGSGRILVMDDETLVAKITCRTLKHFGYRADHVPDGEGAIEAYIKAREEGRPYAAVIMDLTIPGRMGGKQALAKLQEIDPDVKTIVSSGYSTDPIMANYRKYGFSGVLPKPYRLDDLRNVLQFVIASPPGDSSSQAPASKAPSG